MPMKYDRRIDGPLFDALRPGGLAHSLVEYANFGQYALDLQFRGYEGKSAKWATLYVGLTKVLDLKAAPGGKLRLGAHEAYRSGPHGWRSVWEKAMPPDRMAGEWSAVEAYLDHVIPAVAKRYLGEGSVQSAISAFQSRDMLVIDRESAISFKDTAEKNAICRSMEKALLQGCQLDSSEQWTKSLPRSLGGECDALAIAADGAVMIIEVKPAKATTGIQWSPLQVRHYVNLFQRWIETTPHAQEVLEGMVQQRVDLGLAQGRVPRRVDVTKIRPILAIGKSGKHPSQAARRRLVEVQEALAAGGHNDPPLELALVNLVGRLDFCDVESFAESAS